MSWDGRQANLQKRDELGKQLAREIVTARGVRASRFGSPNVKGKTKSTERASRSGITRGEGLLSRVGASEGRLCCADDCGSGFLDTNHLNDHDASVTTVGLGALRTRCLFSNKWLLKGGSLRK